MWGVWLRVTVNCTTNNVLNQEVGGSPYQWYRLPTRPTQFDMKHETDCRPFANQIPYRALQLIRLRLECEQHGWNTKQTSSSQFSDHHTTWQRSSMTSHLPPRPGLRPFREFLSQKRDHYYCKLTVLRRWAWYPDASTTVDFKHHEGPARAYNESSD